jgi:septum formation protein
MLARAVPSGIQSEARVTIARTPAMTPKRLILASGSPRRQTLLGAAGLKFEIAVSGVGEVRRAGEAANDFATRMAREKALSVSAENSGATVLAADTIVVLDGQIFGKPSDGDEARTMLRALSSNTHTVITAFAIARDGSILDSRPVTSEVRFRALTADEIERYVASGEPLDKAGAYGIQDAGAGFIERVAGSRDNVMGLPVREVIEALARHGVAAPPASTN